VTELFSVEVERDFVLVIGKDAESFLQGQLSQDIEVVRARGAAWSFLLQPQGKVDAWLRLSQRDPDEYVLDVDAGFGEVVMARLNRFKLRVAVDITPLDWKCIAVRGDGASEVSGLDAEWPGIEAVDVVGPSVVSPAARAGSIEDYERARILAGVPAMGREITAATIPAEAGVTERSVSFTKGCYTGQELVARIDSRGGNVPHHVRGMRVEGTATPGDRVEYDGRDVGEITSAASDEGETVALAVLARAVVPPATVTVLTGGGPVHGAVVELPR
jgi:folate-binding protein YgfZ